MKKLPLVVFASLLLSAAIGITSCGPSAAEQARLDSIRIADSIRRADSIHIADSLKAVAEAEAQAEALRQKVEQELANVKAEFKAAFPNLGKIIFSIDSDDAFGKIHLGIFNVATGEKKTITLPGSNDWGNIVDIKPKGNDVSAIVTLHNLGSGPFTYNYEYDVEQEKVIRTFEDSY